MRRTPGKRPLLLTVAASCAALVAVSSAAAVPSSAVTLQLRENYDYSTVDWMASAPISGSGTWSKGNLTFHGGKGNLNWAGMIKTTLTSSFGSFDMTFQGRGNGTTGAFSGTWDISHGTGAYAGIHGTGTWFEDDLSEPGVVHFPCEGHVHFD